LAITPLQDIRHPLRLLCFPACFLDHFRLFFRFGFIAWLPAAFEPSTADVALINKLSGVLAASVIRHALVNQHRTDPLRTQPIRVQLKMSRQMM